MRFKFSWKGCLIGCGLVVVLFITLLVGTGLWLTSKGEFEERSTILSEQGDFFVRSYLRAEDELLVNFFSRQAEQLQALDPVAAQFPQFFKNWQNKKARKDIIKMLPLEVEVNGSVLEEDLRIAVGFSLYNNLAGIAFWFVKRAADDEGLLFEYEGTPYVKVDADGAEPYFTLKNNIIYFSALEEGLHQMINDIQSPKSHEEDPRLANVDVTAPIYGFMVGEAARSGWFESIRGGLLEIGSDSNGSSTEPLSEEHEAAFNEFMNRVERVGFSLSMADQDTLAGGIFLEVSTAPELKDLLSLELGRLNDQARLNLEYDVVEASNGYQINYRISGFEEIYADIQEQIQDVRDM